MSFKPGDRITCISQPWFGNIKVGETYTVVAFEPSNVYERANVSIRDEDSNVVAFDAKNFELSRDIAETFMRENSQLMSNLARIEDLEKELESLRLPQDGHLVDELVHGAEAESVESAQVKALFANPYDKEMEKPMSEGIKYDGGKPKLSLLPLQGVLEVAKVGAMGAKKYGDHNFRGGMALTRFLDAAMRHQLAYLNGVDTDAESGLSHLAHAAWNLLAAIEQQIRKPELDDRHYKSEKKGE